MESTLKINELFKIPQLIGSRAKAGSVAQAVEHLPSNHKDLSSNSSTTLKKKSSRARRQIHVLIFWLETWLFSM
jgi:hypothetical protein